MLFPRRLPYYVFGSLIALASLAGGVAPQLEAKPQLFSWQNQAIAQPSATDINNYAEAYLEIYGNNDMSRLLLEVEETIGKKPDWEIRCDQPKTIDRLGNREAIAKVRMYCNEELPALIDGIIPRATFNSISNQLPTNPTLQNQIQDAMLDILKQRQSGN